MGLHHYFDTSYVPPPTGVKRLIAQLEAQISDLEKCLAGNPNSKRWKEINTEVTNMKDVMRLKIRSLHTHGPERSVTGEHRP